MASSPSRPRDAPAGSPRVVFAPDSFKGSLASDEVARILAEELRAVMPSATCVSVAAADGGEGTCAAVAAARGGEWAHARVHGPLGRPVDASYLMLDDGSAVIEMARASGICLVDPDSPDPRLADSRGTGELILDALDRGATSLWVGIGGSATNDAGMGALAALGVRFLDERGDALEGSGRDLARVRSIDLSGLDPRLGGVRVAVMCDVDNPLVGPSGATRVFGPQKGADDACVEELERGMASYARVLDATVGRAVSRDPGAGAAGGLGSALMGVLGGRRLSGIECVLDLTRFDALLSAADLCVTGEGRLDAQSLRGKVVDGVSRHCRRAGVPCAAVVGRDVAPAGVADVMGLLAVEACVDRFCPDDEAMSHAEDNLRRAARRLFESWSFLARVSSGELLRADASDFLHGAVRTTDELGWTRPWRMSESQVRAVCSCLAQHPGLYRQMASCTAGVTVEFDTDATEVALEVILDDAPAGTLACLAPIDPGAPEAHADGMAVDVDGREVDAVGMALPGLGDAALASSASAATLVRVRIDSGADSRAGAGEALPRLPGMDDLRRVRFHLPCLRGCRVRAVLCDGTTLAPVPARDALLVLGDSIAQGFSCGSPSAAWPRLVADALHMDVVNQGLGGQLIQPSSLAGLPSVLRPSRVIVALGENYRYESVPAARMASDARGLLDGIARAWPGVVCWVLTPTWHEEGAWPSRPGNCLSVVPAALEAAVARHAQMELVDGVDLLGKDRALLADGIEHPNARGMRDIARGLLRAMGDGVVRRHVPAKAVASPPKPAARPRSAASDDTPMLPIDFGDFGRAANRDAR